MIATSVAVRERPILFSESMVRAILDGRKTQTRRVVSDRTSRGNYRASELLLNDPRTFADPGPSPAGNPGWYLHAHLNAPLIEARRGWEPGDCDPEIVERLYPWVFVGDQLWVREGWRWFGRALGGGVVTGGFEYREGQTQRKFEDFAEPDSRWEDFKAAFIEDRANSWKPSIHMPRWASRITLEITNVRVERVQDISTADAWAEGIRPEDVAEHAGDGTADLCDPETAVIDDFRMLWDSLNAPRGFSWIANPWVWVLEFRRVDA